MVLLLDELHLHIVVHNLPHLHIWQTAYAKEEKVK